VPPAAPWTVLLLQQRNCWSILLGLLPTRSSHACPENVKVAPFECHSLLAAHGPRKVCPACGAEGRFQSLVCGVRRTQAPPCLRAGRPAWSPPLAPSNAGMYITTNQVLGKLVLWLQHLVSATAPVPGPCEPHTAQLPQAGSGPRSLKLPKCLGGGLGLDAGLTPKELHTACAP